MFALRFSANGIDGLLRRGFFSGHCATPFDFYFDPKASFFLPLFSVHSVLTIYTPTNTPTDTPTATSTPTSTPTFDYAGCVGTIASGDVSGLIAAIDAANAASDADDICLEANGTYEFASAAQDDNAFPLITSPISIYGNGAIITRDENADPFRFFLVEQTGGDLSLYDLTLEGGDAWMGGAIISDGSLSLENVSFIENNTWGSGGALISNGTLVARDSLFQANTANDYAAALQNWGPASLIDVQFTGNVAGYGGAINNDGDLVIEDALFHNNQAWVDGGAIRNGLGTVNISDSCFAGNTDGEPRGGAISNHASTVYAQNNWWNSASGPGEGSTGAADSVSDNVEFTPFMTSTPGHCASLDYTPTPTNTPTPTSTNTPTVDPSICDYSVYDVSTLISAINDANSETNPDVICVTSGNYEFVDAENNSNALPIITSTIFVQGNGSVFERGSEAPNFRFFEITFGATLILNNLTLRGGDTLDGAAILNHGTLNTDLVSFENNGTGGSGGAISNTGSLNIHDSQFVDGYAWDGGAGINSDGGTVNVTETTFQGNVAAWGAGINTYNGANLSVADSVFVDNEAFYLAGGGINTDSAAEIHNTCFIDNTDAEPRGGAISYWGYEAVDATDNWWNSEFGPGDGSTGVADSVSANVNFTPYLTELPAHCPTEGGGMELSMQPENMQSPNLEAEELIEPEVTATEVSLVALPWVDSFDIQSQWVATGSWRFVPGRSLAGSGWSTDAMQRNSVSTLELITPIVLSGAHPTLRFYQQGQIVTGDIVAVDVLPMGTNDWQQVDQQLALENNWSVHAVDLSAYTDQTIRLRFRLMTFGFLTEGESVSGFSLDELNIQDLPVTPTVELTPSPTLEPVSTETTGSTEIPTASITPSQTSAPTLELPTAAVTYPPTPTPTPISLPFIENFNDPTKWTADGWSLELQSDRGTAGWVWLPNTTGAGTLAALTQRGTLDLRLTDCKSSELSGQKRAVKRRRLSGQNRSQKE